MTNQQPIRFVTKRQLITDLRSMGLQSGDTLMLHAAVKAIGWIVGGPRVVIDALLDVLSPDGTIMMLASWDGNPYEVLDEIAVDQRQQIMDEWPAFDPLTSPAAHREMSILAEYVRTWPGSQRSTHPLASFAAVGRRAMWLTETHQLNYGLGADSPLARLCEANGRVIMIGAPPTYLTLLHHAEHLVDLPEKHIDRYQMPILRDGKKVWVDVEEFDTTDGIADFGVEDAFNAIGLAYIAAGHGKVGMVGNAQTYLFEAEALKRFAMQWMQQHYRADS
jgi:aminoglycoside 3-N-acetyltransferase